MRLPGMDEQQLQRQLAGLVLDKGRSALNHGGQLLGFREPGMLRMPRNDLTSAVWTLYDDINGQIYEGRDGNTLSVRPLRLAATVGLSLHAAGASKRRREDRRKAA